MPKIIEVFEEASEKTYKRKDMKPDNRQQSATRSAQVNKFILYGLQQPRARYTDDENGFNAFKRQSLLFWEELTNWNNAQEESKNIVCPSVELWASFLGISRRMLNYYTQYSYPEYKEFIGVFKNSIQSAKFDFASHGSMPPVLYIFDSINNGDGYRNTNEILHVTTEQPRIATSELQQKYLQMDDNLPG